MTDTLTLVVRWSMLWREERAMRLGGVATGARLATISRMLMEAEAALAGRIGAPALSGLTTALYADERRAAA